MEDKWERITVGGIELPLVLSGEELCVAFREVLDTLAQHRIDNLPKIVTRDEEYERAEKELGQAEAALNAALRDESTKKAFLEYEDADNFMEVLNLRDIYMAGFMDGLQVGKAMKARAAVWHEEEGHRCPKDGATGKGQSTGVTTVCG
ncbi:MAG TPA: hypothetical protein GX510_10055 [Firmicutes bacterium]|nr:hypothetical protein [Candidatus Fermentithermobacillaceae bacterium]